MKLYILLSGLILFSFLSQAQRKNIELEIIDSTEVIQLDDSTKLWFPNEKNCLLTTNDHAQIWSAISAVDKWQLNSFTTVWTIEKKLKLWVTGDSVVVWDINPKNKDWKRTGTAQFQKFNDSTKIWKPGLSFLMSDIKDTIRFWTYENRTRLWKQDKTPPEILLNDTIKLWAVADTSKIALLPDSSVLWKQYSAPKPWELSSVTKVWAIDRLTELWKTDGRIKIWTRLTPASNWGHNKFVRPLSINDSTRLWLISNNKFLIEAPTTVKAWKTDINTSIFNLTDSLKVWKEIPPPEPVAEIVKVKPAKSVLSVIDTKTKIWKLKDGRKILKSGKNVELWTLNKTSRSWKVNDTTTIWIINEKTQFTIINDTSRVWSLVDSTKIWVPQQAAKYQKLDANTRVWTISPILKLESKNGKNIMWDVNQNVKLTSACKNDEDNVYSLNDTISIWRVENDKLFWVVNDETKIWKAIEKQEVWAINDTTKFWRVNENTRIAQLTDSIAIWKYSNANGQDGWSIVDNISKNSINDSTFIWIVAENIHFWKQGKDTRLWERDKITKVFDVTDTLKLYTYQPEPLPKKKVAVKKKSYWTLSGDGNFHVSQIYYKNWSKFIPNKLSALALLKLYAKYSRNNTKFENVVEFRHERYSTSEYTDVMRGQDKLEFNSRFGQRALKHWYYSANVYFRSQLLEGFNYPNDSVAVSRFLSPGFVNFSVGMDFKPSKNFSLYLAPATYKLTYVLDSSLVATKRKHKIDEDKRFREEKGGEMIVEFKLNLMKNITYWNKLRLFSNYKENPENIDIRWESTLNMKVNKYVNASIRTLMIYDHDIPIPLMTRDADGKSVQKTDAEGNKLTGPRLQFNEVLSVGLSYSF